MSRNTLPIILDFTTGHCTPIVKLLERRSRCVVLIGVQRWGLKTTIVYRGRLIGPLTFVFAGGENAPSTILWLGGLCLPLNRHPTPVCRGGLVVSNDAGDVVRSSAAATLPLSFRRRIFNSRLRRRKRILSLMYSISSS